MAKNKAVRTMSRYLNYLIFGLAIKGKKTITVKPGPNLHKQLCSFMLKKPIKV